MRIVQVRPASRTLALAQQVVSQHQYTNGVRAAPQLLKIQVHDLYERGAPTVNRDNC